MPKLGESIREATITKWFVHEGDPVKEDDILFEVATDKVDSEIPSPVEGIISRILHPVESTLPVGEVVAVIRLEGSPEKAVAEPPTAGHTIPSQIGERELKPSEISMEAPRIISKRFYSPLVRRIAKEEKVTAGELEKVKGTGTSGRVRKKDILGYLEQRNLSAEHKGFSISPGPGSSSPEVRNRDISVTAGAEDEIVEMDRIRKLIADHMVMSKRISPHVTSVVEADVTNLVRWRNQVKEDFQVRYGEKLTYMPLFIEAVTRALGEFPGINASVDGDRIILRRNRNIGIAVARPDGNLIVPVIKNSEEKNLVGITKALNHLAEAARTGRLNPEEIQGGTFTITNFGSFRNLIGTPIINQPQVAILATGSIEKKPAVLELPSGDVIAIRHKMYLSLSYDHRVVDGAMGGAFLRRIADLLEAFDVRRTI